jgi:hypothetical protein
VLPTCLTSFEVRPEYSESKVSSFIKILYGSTRHSMIYVHSVTSPTVLREDQYLRIKRIGSVEYYDNGYNLTKSSIGLVVTPYLFVVEPPQKDMMVSPKIYKIIDCKILACTFVCS